MPPRVAYWTSGFEPKMEAISAEVAMLRRQFPRSVIWGLSHRHWILLSRQRGFCLNLRLHHLFRLVTRVMEPVWDLNHIFGSLGDWFYLQGRRRRPTVLTMVAQSPPVERPLLDRVDRFVVEYPGGEEQVERLGIDRERVRVIFPPVDLERFLPDGGPAPPFTVLFASSPEEASWLEARGVPQLLDAAALRPAMRFRMLWRPWGDSLPRVRDWITRRGLRNVELIVGQFADMAHQYRAGHVTVALFSDLERCKPAPNSLIESLACGRPVITTPQVGLAGLIGEERAGIICPAEGAALAESLDRLQAEWSDYSRRARGLAERYFAVETFVTAYQRLYQELVS